VVKRRSGNGVFGLCIDGSRTCRGGVRSAKMRTLDLEGARMSATFVRASLGLFVFASNANVPATIFTNVESVLIL
jgi:hypothetical protein